MKGGRPPADVYLESLAQLDTIYAALRQVDVTPIFDTYRELLRQIRGEGISISDRRAIKLLKLIGAAALRRGAWEASPADLWVLLHVWNKPAQISALQAMVGPVVERAGGQAVRAERTLTTLHDDVERLARLIGEHTERTLSTASCSVLVQDLDALRKELLVHSDGQRSNGAREQWDVLVERVETLTDTLLDILEANERM